MSLLRVGVVVLLVLPQPRGAAISSEAAAKWGGGRVATDGGPRNAVVCVGPGKRGEKNQDREGEERREELGEGRGNRVAGHRGATVFGAEVGRGDDLRPDKERKED